MDFSLSEEQVALRDTVHEFAEKEIRPLAPELDEKSEFSWDIMRKAAKLGLTCASVPEEYGGPGLALLDGTIIYEELAWGCVGVTGGILLNSIAILPVIISGSTELKEKYLTGLTDPDNPRLCAFGLTEPGAGSDVASMTTTATPDNGQYVLNGQKCFITNAGVAELYSIFATVDKSDGIKGITGFLVEADTPGLSIGKIEHKMGLRSSQTAELILDDVRVDAENVIGQERRGFYTAMQALDCSRPFVGALGVGVARASYEAALSYAKERVQFGQPIFKQQAISFMLADMATEIDMARLLCQRAAWMLDNGMDASKESSMSKYVSTDTAMRVATNAVQIHGGYGYMKEYPVEKWFRDAKILQIIEGTNQIQRLVLAGRL